MRILANGTELQSDGTYKLEWLTGTKKLEPIRYFIRSRQVPLLYFFSKIEYYVETDFMVLGPFKSVEACFENLTLGGIGVRDIEIDV